MNAYSPAYNKKYNQFEQGIRQIRNRNGNFFENTISGNSIYDLKDIKSYFEVIRSEGKTVLNFRNSSGLPDKIRNEISTLFFGIWPEEDTAETAGDTLNTTV